jgi:hypothetical protein
LVTKATTRHCSQSLAMCNQFSLPVGSTFGLLAAVCGPLRCPHQARRRTRNHRASKNSGARRCPAATPEQVVFFGGKEYGVVGGTLAAKSLMIAWNDRVSHFSLTD